MELKSRKLSVIKGNCWILLIEPYGIEIEKMDAIDQIEQRLLIEPYGIEIRLGLLD